MGLPAHHVREQEDAAHALRLLGFHPGGGEQPRGQAGELRGGVAARHGGRGRCHAICLLRYALSSSTQRCGSTDRKACCPSARPSSAVRRTTNSLPPQSRWTCVRSPRKTARFTVTGQTLSLPGGEVSSRRR